VTPRYLARMRREPSPSAARGILCGLAIVLVLWVVAFLVLYAIEAQATPNVRRTYATAYCLQGRMADGSWVRPRSAAANYLRLGTRIRLVGRPFFGGLRRFVIRYCSAGCAIRKGNTRIRESYSCTHLNYVCHVGVPAVDWLNGNWGWSGNIGRRCRRVLTQEFSCHPITSGGQIRKRDGAWRGVWVRFG
jgi:hypothetical protein